MLERDVESRFKWLEGFGFAVLKFYTSHSGTMDRLILFPKWSPAPPVAVELKRPGKHERLLQEKLAQDWIARGVDVRPMCDTVEKVHDLCIALVREAYFRLTPSQRAEIPDHIRKAVSLHPLSI